MRSNNDNHWNAQSNMIPTPPLLARYTHSGLGADDVLGVEVTAAGVDAAVAQSPGYFEYLKDAQGTITDITDSNGNKIQHFIYSGFGKLLGVQTAAAAEISWPSVSGIKGDGSPGISQSSDPGDLAARENLAKPALFTPYTYTGREFDSESGNYYYRARYYDPNIGRFLQRDLHPGSLTMPDTFNNPYAYTSNNPIMRTDPSGLAWGWVKKIGRGIKNAARVIGTGLKVMAKMATNIVIGAVAIVIGTVLIASGVFLVKPALVASFFTVGADLILGTIAAPFTGSMPKLDYFHGQWQVENSFFAGLGKSFSLGPSAFIKSEKKYKEEFEKGEYDHSKYIELRRHEYGHYLQYKKYGDWNYVRTGLAHKGEGSHFEFEADQLATEYFGELVCNYGGYPDHIIPQCR